MKTEQQKMRIAFLALIFFSVQIVSNQLFAQNNLGQKNTLPAKTQIALLGVYHFDNPNQDMFNVKSDSILSEKKQKEIEELAKQLAKFKPTHIALEFNKNDDALEKRYQEYLNDKYQLSANEREQIGFRLARMLGHQHIYPVDEPSIQVEFNPGKLAEEFSPLLQQLSENGNKVIGQINKWVQAKPIGVVLSQMNTQELDKLNIDLYYRYFLPIGKGGEQPGLESVVRWYKRNLFILQHIRELKDSDKSEKRILVVFGQGHTAMLKQFMQYSSEFEVVDIQQFLPKK
jgi:Family of unknown function (DUF5694)